MITCGLPRENLLLNFYWTVTVEAVSLRYRYRHPLNREDALIEITAMVVGGTLALLALVWVGCFGFKRDRG